MALRVLFDACVLLPYQLCDLVLRLGETDIFQPTWSAEILEEVRRNLVSSFGKTDQQASRRMDQMRTAFPLAMVGGHEALTPVMTNDPKDRHVLAAAVHSQTAIIVTANLKDFPAAALSAYGIEAVHPDEFLQDQLDLYPRQTLKCFEEQRAAYTRPRLTKNEFFQTLGATVPGFTDSVRALDAGRTDTGSRPETKLPRENAPATRY